MANYITAKSYAKAKWISEPFEENGRMYVTIQETCGRCCGNGHISYYGHIDGGICFDCHGTGFFQKTVRVYSEKEIAAQEAAKARKEARRLKALEDASEANKREWMEKNGFDEDGLTWCVFGDDTFAIKDALKEMGCKFNPMLKWHGPKALELPDGFGMVPIAFDDILTWDMYSKTADYKEDAEEKIEKVLKQAAGPSTTEYYEGEVGDRVRNITAVFKSVRGFDSRFGWTNIYTFDSGNNCLVWFTTKTLDFEKGQTVDFTGTIKAFEEFRGVKTTQFTRCIIKAIN